MIKIQNLKFEKTLQIVANWFEEVFVIKKIENTVP